MSFYLFIGPALTSSINCKKQQVENFLFFFYLTLTLTCVTTSKITFFDIYTFHAYEMVTELSRDMELDRVLHKCNADHNPLQY